MHEGGEGRDVIQLCHPFPEFPKVVKIHNGGPTCLKYYSIIAEDGSTVKTNWRLHQRKLLFRFYILKKFLAHDKLYFFVNFGFKQSSTDFQFEFSFLLAACKINFSTKLFFIRHPHKLVIVWEKNDSSCRTKVCRQ